MTRSPSRSLDAGPIEVDLGATRSRFLFARAQSRAHARTADYLRAREAGLAERTATAWNARTA